MRFSSYLEVVYPFQERWLYNNWGYKLADEVVEKVSGKTWGMFLRERIFSPLGMHDTTTAVNPSTENVAKAYMALSDGTPHRLPRPKLGDGNLGQGAVGIQSNVRDLLTFYKNLMIAEQEQRHGEQDSTPLKEIATIMSPHIALDSEPRRSERSYGLGMVRTELPGSLGVIGLNPKYVNQMPIVGKGLETPQLCIYHQGSIVTYLSSAYLLPGTNTAIVVLTNSMANNDAANWLGQMLLETVLDNPEKNDYVAIAKESAATSVALWPKMAKELEVLREPGTPRKPPIVYVGKYYNIIADWCIDVYDEGGLKMCFQGQRDKSYRLDHLRNDGFSWLLTRNEIVHQGRFPVINLEFYILMFGKVNDAGYTDQLIWRHDPDVPSGEIFFRHPRD